MWYLYWRCDSGIVSFLQDHAPGNERWDRPTAWHIARFKAFAAADRDMRGKRTCLPDGAGVVYENGDTRVLWAFIDQALPAAVEDLVAGGSANRAVKHGVYRWQVR